MEITRACEINWGKGIRSARESLEERQIDLDNVLAILINQIDVNDLIAAPADHE
jgi:hypothetical protein